MSRRREVPKRLVHPDPKYGDRMVGRFTNVIMKDGKKSTAEHIVYGAFDVIVLNYTHATEIEFGEFDDKRSQPHRRESACPLKSFVPLDVVQLC